MGRRVDLVIVVLVAVFAGCPRTTPEQTCNANADCANNESCQDGACRGVAGGSSGLASGSSSGVASSGGSSGASGTGSSGTSGASGSSGASGASSGSTSSSAGSSSGGGSCGSGRILCGTTCIDPLTDTLFCGASGDCMGLNAGQVCTDKACVDGSCESDCPNGLIKCVTAASLVVCIDPDADDVFCGASGDCTGTNAGVTCLGDLSCTDGNCGCPTGQVECGTRCLAAGSCCEDTDCTAPQVCGAEDSATPPARACQCPPGSKVCGATCVTTASCCETSECTGTLTCATLTGGSGMVEVRECRCPEGQFNCSGTCTVGSGCCDDGDCTGGRECASSSGGSSCSCPSGTRECTRFNRCVPNAECCLDSECSSGKVCQDSGTSTSCVCAPGTYACGSSCIPVGTCCASNDLCPTGSVCLADGLNCEPGCRIAGVPVGSGSTQSGNACNVCSPGSSLTDWTPRTACTGGDGCCPGGCNGSNDGDCGTVIDGACGSTGNTCTAGSPTNHVAGACGGMQTWTCQGSNGGNSASCMLNNAPCPVNGACSTSAGQCVAGSVTADNNQTACGTARTWSCAGTNGGSTAACSINNAACPVNGACSTTPGQCVTGSPTGDDNETTCGTTRDWTCAGANGGSSATCSVNNGACGPSCGTISATWQGTRVLRLTASGASNVTSMLAPTWGDANGQNDLQWVPLVDQGGGTWTADATGWSEAGTYTTHFYAANAQNPSPGVLCQATASTRPPFVTVTLQVAGDGQIGTSVGPTCGPGSVAACPVSFQVDPGAQVAFYQVTNSGRFGGFSTGTANGQQVTITTDTTVTAHFCPANTRFTLGACRAVEVSHSENNSHMCRVSGAFFAESVRYAGPGAMACEEFHINNPNRLNDHKTCGPADYIPMATAPGWSYDAGTDTWSHYESLPNHPAYVPNGYDVAGDSSTAEGNWYYVHHYVSEDGFSSASNGFRLQNQGGNYNACN